MPSRTTVPTDERFAGLEPRDVTRRAAGFLLSKRSCVYVCPDCGTRREFPEAQLIRWVLHVGPESAPDGRFAFDCEGCPLHVRVGLVVEELPSWSGNLRAQLDATLLEIRV